MTPEGKVKQLVKRLASEYGAYMHAPVQNGMGAPSLDFVGCYKGLFFAVETKAKGKKPTTRQLATANKMRAAGGVVFFIIGEEDVGAFEKWLTEVT